MERKGRDQGAWSERATPGGSTALFAFAFSFSWLPSAHSVDCGKFKHLNGKSTPPHAHATHTLPPELELCC